jgi:hypothetical protein
MRPSGRVWRGELAHAITRKPNVRRPEAGVESGLALQRADEFARLRELLPHLRQEGRPPAAPLQHDAVLAGHELRQRLGLVE